MQPIANIEADVTRKEFTVRTDDPLCTEDNLQIGNFVMIDNRLKTISFPRTWETGHVTLTIAD